MATDEELGSDISCIDDLDPNLTLVVGRVAHMQAVVRSVSTPSRSLFYDPDYGYDARRRLHAAGGDLVVAQKIEQQALRDERTRDVSAAVEFIRNPTAQDDVADQLNIDIQLEDDEGPFDFTLQVTDVSVAVLAEN